MTSMERDHFVAMFQDLATKGLVAGVSTFEQLYVEEIREGDEDVLHAVALVNYDGRPYRFRKRFWPTNRDPDLAAAIYVAGLEECLRTHTPTAQQDPNVREELR